MDPLPTRVEASIDRLGLAPNGVPLVVAVSGGLDSVVLLEVLRRLAPARNWRLVVAHLNHQIRGRSAGADARLVESLALALKVPFSGAVANVPKIAKKTGASIEMAARDARHRFLASVSRRRKAYAVALAHQADDQVESFFLRLFRGSGGLGLGGMKWESPSPVDPQTRLIRPLLDVSRDEIEQFARANQLRWREDATNADLKIPRNRVRHELVPLLIEHYCPALRSIIPRTMEILRADAELSERMATDAGDVPSAHLAVRRSAVRRQMEDVGEPVSFRRVESQLGAAKTGTRRSNRWPTRSGTLKRAFRVVLEAEPRRVAISDAIVSWAFRRDPLPFESGRGRYEQFDADAVSDPVELRFWKPGDRFHMLGKRRPAKLQDLFTGRKVAPELRRSRLIAADASGRIFWVEGLPPGELQKVTASTRRVLVWKWRR